MIAFQCSGCRKPLSAQPDLAGKTVKCRSCGQMSVVPSSTARVALDNMRTLPPAHSQSSAPDVTHDLAAGEPGHDASLTAFLAPPQTDDELGRLGGFRILKVLGHGGMGVVFQGEDPKLGRQVAIKAMLPHLAGNKVSQERFLREARSAAALEHDHIVPILQVGEDRGSSYIVMPFLKGEPLDVRLQREPKLPVADILRIGREIAEGLAAAHERGLIHRDIKPANVWLEAPRQRVKILDFGLARATAEKSNLTRLGSIIGSPAYASPEQAGGEKLDGRTDLWSLGVVLYRLCTGSLPFAGTDIVTMLMSVATEQPKPPAQVNAAIPAGLSDLVMKLLRKDPKERPASAQQVIAALQALEGQITVPSVPSTALSASPFADLPESTVPLPAKKKTAPQPLATPLRARKPDRRRILIIAGAAAAVVLLLVSGIVLLWPTPPEVVKDDKGTASRDLPRPPTVPDKSGNDIAALSAEQQVQAVMAKLKELNPGFDGKETHVVDQTGVVTELQMGTDKVKDISPVRGLTGLRKLNVAYTRQLADLSPLKGLKLTHLYCGDTQVSDLSPLRGMKLTELVCRATKVTDLSPLKDMKLTSLDCDLTPVSDLSPLKDMKLTTLSCGATRVADLSPLRDMQLTWLNCSFSAVSDLTPLKGMPLTALICAHTPVSDLSPLKDMKLTRFGCEATNVTDLSPLKGMPLKDIGCDFKPQRDAEILRSIETLEKINGNPAKEVLAAVLLAEQQVQAVMAKLKELNPGFDGQETHVVDKDGVVTELQFVTDNVKDISPVRALTGLETLDCSGNFPGKGRLADLSPLKGMKLTKLSIGNTQVSDLSPLKGMKLTQLKCYITPVSDLSPLKDMKLTEELNIASTAVSDLSPLKDMQLKRFYCSGAQVSDLSPLHGMSLEIVFCDGTKVTDLSPLKGVPLTSLSVHHLDVSDLSPLKDMKLSSLWCQDTKVTDLSVLRGMPLKELHCDYKPERDAAILRSIKTLETINDKPAKEVLGPSGTSADGEQQVKAVMDKLKELNPGFDGKEKHVVDKDGVVTELQFVTDKVRDISPLRALTGLESLDCSGSGWDKGQLADLSPLKDMKLTRFNCNYTSRGQE